MTVSAGLNVVKRRVVLRHSVIGLVFLITIAILIHPGSANQCKETLDHQCAVASREADPARAIQDSEMNTSTAQLYEDSRRALLNYYNSQTMTHGGYIIAMIVAFAALLSEHDKFFSSWRRRVMFYAIFSLLLGLGVSVAGRTLYWGFLANEVIFLPLNDLTGVGEPPSSLIGEIQLKAASRIAENPNTWNQIASYFSHFRLPLLIEITVCTTVALVLIDRVLRFHIRRLAARIPDLFLSLFR